MQQLMWFRNDLRVNDNSALAQAAAQGSVIGIYLISAKQWALHQDASCKIDFWRRNLEVLEQQLQQLNIPLVLLIGDDWQQAPQLLLDWALQHKISSLHFNQQAGVNEQLRDQAVAELFAAQGITCHSYQDQLLLAAGSVHNQQGEPYKVFSAFKKACSKRLEFTTQREQTTPSKQAATTITSSSVSKVFAQAGIVPADARYQQLWPAGEVFAKQRLQEFLETAITEYELQRDFPSLAGTSQLSPYLAAGVISIRHCFNQALQLNHGELLSGNLGISSWLNELLWREFYLHLLSSYPALSKHQPFKAHTQSISWRTNPTDFDAWCQGKTGIPILDAAMRQLLATGWMHNRLRMLSASFLTKNLLIDWRLGEAWFMQHLIDGDLAANNGGWQWCASTGTDAVPYFRVFNPVIQSQRFDPKADFIRQWLPELASLSDKECHLPPQQPLLLQALNYPEMIVDLKASRLRAIEAFSKRH